MKKICLFITCFTVLSAYSQEKVKFSFGKRNVAAIQVTAPALFTQSDGYNYAVHYIKPKYGRKVYEIFKYDKQVNEIATNRISADKKSRIFQNKHHIFYINTWHDKKVVNYAIHKIDKTTLEVGPQTILFKFSDELFYKLKPSGYNPDAKLRIICNEKTGNFVILKEHPAKKEDAIRCTAVCLDKDANKLWEREFEFNVTKANYNIAPTYSIHRSNYIHITNTNATLVQNSNDLRDMVLTGKDELFMLLHPNRTLSKKSKDKNFTFNPIHKLALVTEKNDISYFEFKFFYPKISTIALRESKNNNILVFGLFHKMSKSIKTGLATTKFDRSTNQFSEISEVISSDTKANNLFHPKQNKKFNEKRFQGSFALTNICETESGYTLIAEEVNVKIYSDGGETATIAKNYAHNISIFNIGLDGKILGSEIIGRRHFTINDFSRHSKLGLVETADNYHLFYHDDIDNIRGNQEYDVWKARSAKKTLLNHVLINKSTNDVKKLKPIISEDLDFGLMPYTFSKINDNLFIGLAQKFKGFKIAQYTFTIE